MKCDLSKDCEDASDEDVSECERSPLTQNECDKENFLHCKYSRKCIPKEWQCDSEYDCGLKGRFDFLDTSDEDSSLNCTKKCPPNKLPCSNGECIHISKFCDGHIDCPNDEFSCLDKSDCKKLKCEFDYCRTTPFGPKCYCPPNQDIINGTKCVAQKFCSENEFGEDSCDQICTLMKGRKKCSCANGYEWVNQKCQGINSKFCFIF